VIVVDGDERAAHEFVAQALADSLIEPVPIVVVGSFDNPESTARFVELGAARVLPKPVSPDVLRRTVEELRERAAKPRGQGEPLGDISIAALSERIAAEFKRGLVDALDSGSPEASVPLGEGHDVLAAVWGAVARVRELVTLRSSGSLRFEPVGPEGAVPVAPWNASERRAGERGLGRTREPAGISLQGRRIIVADDDPAVVWFMSGLLKAVGVEVIEAHDGRRALSLAFEEWPDAIISDVLMPKLDGFSLCHEIKRDVAVRDVPVILLSWKEDLLQRVRELGAAADGYLRKEAAASTVVERVREVLRPRARVEERIAAGGEVRGRLDGLTPRLILELACREQRDVRISVRDAAFLFEAQIRRGRLVSLTRSSADGGFVRGPAVLGSLLGAGAGRFVVEPDSSAARSELTGTLREILREPVDRARASLASVSAAALVRLRRLEVDREVVDPYLACTPEPALGAARRVLAGESPAELVLTGAVAPRLLEVVLSDIARRDGVTLAELDPAPVVPGASAPPEPPLTPAPPFSVATPTAGTPATDSSWFIDRRDATSHTPRGLGPERVEEDGTQGVSPPPESAAAAAVSVEEPASAPNSADAAASPVSSDRELGELVGALDDESGPLHVKGGEGTLGFSDQVTPAVEPSEPLFDFGSTPAPTLDGLGVAPVSAPASVPAFSEPEPTPASTPAAKSKRPRRESDSPSPPKSLGVPVEPSRLPTLPPQRDRDEKKERPTSWVAVLFRTLLAGAVAFGITSWGILPLLSKDEPRESPAPEPAANLAPPPPAATASAPPVLRSEELDPPEGLELPAGHGLLEIESAGTESIYVDEAFVGRGPVRRVPTPAGRHSVEVRGEASSSRIEISLAAGRRVRIPAAVVAGPAAPAASPPR
jgi:DNA-binding response OmpR family regulator